MSKNRNYTNYSKPNKPAETTPEANPDENVQNLQETPENEVDDTLLTVGCGGEGTMLNPSASENTEPATNAAPDDQITQPEPEASKAVIGTVANCAKLNIRAEANAKAEVLCVINKGDEIEIIEEESTDDFYAVIFGKDKSVSVEGYCMKQYIKINN